MKRALNIFFGLVLFCSGLFAQSKSLDTVRVLLTVDKKPLPGASYIIKGTTTGTVSDINGLTTLIVPSDKEKVVVSIIGPYIELSILRPVDSISFDLDSKKATYYYKQVKIKARRQLIEGY
jgi:hypothetical protein